MIPSTASVLDVGYDAVSITRLADSSIGDDGADDYLLADVRPAIDSLRAPRYDAAAGASPAFAEISFDGRRLAGILPRPAHNHKPAAVDASPAC